MDEVISQRMAETRVKILEHFDEDVHARLKTHLDQTATQLDRFSRMFWAVSKAVLADRAGFDDSLLSFFLDKPPHGVAAEKGVYHLIAKEKDGHNERGRFLYRPSHPLAEFVVETARGYRLIDREVVFDITNHSTRISMVEALKGQFGWLTLERLTVSSFDEDECLLFSGFTDGGQPVDQEICEKLFDCGGIVGELANDAPASIRTRLKELTEVRKHQALAEIEARNQTHFAEERDKLDKWVRDVEIAAEKNLRDTKDRIRELEREAAKTTIMAEQVRIQERILELGRTKRRQQREVFDLQDEAEAKRSQLIDDLRKRMRSESAVEPLFTIRWRVV